MSCKNSDRPVVLAESCLRIPEESDQDVVQAQKGQITQMHEQVGGCDAKWCWWRYEWNGTEYVCVPCLMLLWPSVIIDLSASVVLVPLLVGLCRCNAMHVDFEDWSSGEDGANFNVNELWLIEGGQTFWRSFDPSQMIFEWEFRRSFDPSLNVIEIWRSFYPS